MAYKVYNQNSDLKHVYKYSDFLKRKESKLVFDSYEYDFGKVMLNKNYISNFSFTNKGDKKIKIMDVLTTCGCTVTSWSKDAVFPGNKGNVQVSCHAGPVGDFEKEIAIMVADDNKPIQLKIKGNVIAR